MKKVKVKIVGNNVIVIFPVRRDMHIFTIEEAKKLGYIKQEK